MADQDLDQFDARRLRALPNGEASFKGYPMLRLMVTDTTRTWTLKYGTKQYKFGELRTMNDAKARVEWERLRALLAAGGDPKAEKQAATAAVQRAVGKKGGKTVGEIVMFRFENLTQANRQKEGADKWLASLKKHLAMIWDTPAEGLSRELGYDTIAVAASTAPTQAIKLRGYLVKVWNTAANRGLISPDTPNWWASMMEGEIKSRGRLRGGKRQKEQRTLSPVEMATLIRWLPNFSRNVKDILAVYLWTGLRGVEICQMHASQFHAAEDALWWMLDKSDTKNADVDGAVSMIVPLVGYAREIIQARIDAANGGYLFVPEYNGKGKGNDYMDQRVVGVAVYERQPYAASRPEWVRDRLAVTDWSPHDLRRSSRTLLASVGCTDEVAEAVLGHKKQGVVGIYNKHTYDAHKLVWLRVLDSKLKSLAWPEKFSFDRELLPPDAKALPEPMHPLARAPTASPA